MVSFSGVLFLRSTGLGTFFLWDVGLTWGTSEYPDVTGIVLRVFPRGAGETSNLSRVWGNAGAVLVVFLGGGITGDFSSVRVCGGSLSWVGKALSNAWLKNWVASASCRA